MEPLTAHSEREWILIGIVESCAARGYEATTVDDICAAAGVSRQSFERAFAGVGECAGAAVEALAEEAWEALERVSSPGKPWGATLREGVAALLGLLAERPAFARLALVEAPAAGGRAAALAASSRASLLAFLERGRALAEPGVPAGAARGALAGAEAVLVGQILEGNAKRLPELAPDLVYMLAVPFLGIGEAQRLASKPAARGHLRAVA